MDLGVIQPMGLDSMPFEEPEIPAELNTVGNSGNKEGISETLDAVNFLLSLGTAVKNSLSDDGKITISDSLKFFIPVTKLPAMITGIKDIPAELADIITEEEQAEIIKAVEESGIAEGESEAVAIEALQITLAIKNFIFKHFVK